MNKKTGARIAELRKSLQLTQGQFAEKIGLKFSAISMIELEKAPLTEANIRLICFTFNVNETWLRTGEGDMLNKPPESPSTNEEQTLLNNFRRLLPETRLAILKIVQDMQKDPESTK